MKKYKLCRFLPEVSELCFAVAHMGSVMSKISEEEGAQLILSGLDRGINFLDTTAQMYRPYSRIKKALAQFPREVVLSVRTTAADQKGMLKDIEDARQSLDRECIDLFLLHINKSTESLMKNKAGAFTGLLEAQSKGWIRAIGLSTHSIRLLQQAAELEFIDVLNPAVNQSGLGIREGQLSDLLQTLQNGHAAGKGIYAMKTLAGGRLATLYRESFNFVREIPEICSSAIGMSSLEELNSNLQLFEQPRPQALKSGIFYPSKSEVLPPITFPGNRTLKRFSTFCKGCGICINNCPSDAMVIREGKVQVDEEKCLLCGYCTSVCPQFALRLD